MRRRRPSRPARGRGRPSRSGRAPAAAGATGRSSPRARVSDPLWACGARAASGGGWPSKWAFDAARQAPLRSVRPEADHRAPVRALAEMAFIAVDTATTGRLGDLCEVTEVGCVLVGGGELHEEWSSLVRVERPLSRGIQRFTGITQAMVDDAPPPEEVLPRLAEMLEGRVLVAHNAQFDRRVLRQAFERCEVKWPNPPVLCTVSM